MIKYPKYLILLTFIFTLVSCIPNEGNSSVNILEKHLVTFNPNNGDDSYTIEVEHNSRITKIFDPYLEGYTFDGWYDQYDEKWIFSSYLVTGDLTLTAKWSEVILSENSSSNSSSEENNESNSDIVIPPIEETTVNFLMCGGTNETQVYREIVSEFNNIYDGTIEVKLKIKNESNYDNALITALNSQEEIDVLFVNETGVKELVEQELLMDISDYVEKSKECDVSSMWNNAVNRFKYDVETKTNFSSNSSIYAVPNQMNTTALFYNETLFEQADIKIISVASSDLKAFNEGAADDRGQTKASLGITDEVKEKGYFVDSKGQRWFNNQVPMSWEETISLANRINLNSTITSYYNESWFNYGWSVGGDIVQYITTDNAKYAGGVWDFTLMDPTKNYIVDDNAEPFVINGHTYQPGEILSYQDKLIDEEKMLEKLGQKDDRARTVDPKVLAAVETGQLEVLPSQREAFTEFMRLDGVTRLIDIVDNKSIYSYEISSTIDINESSKLSMFCNGNIGMLVDKLSNIPEYVEQNIFNNKWDVAPLPIYKKYDSKGNIIVHGVQTGYSETIGIGISNKTTKGDSAWKFIEYIFSDDVLKKLYKNNISLPIKKYLAQDNNDYKEYYPDTLNFKVFIESAEHQKAADWTYFKDTKWMEGYKDALRMIKTKSYILSNVIETQEYETTYSKLLKYTEK